MGKAPSERTCLMGVQYYDRCSNKWARSFGSVVTSLPIHQGVRIQSTALLCDFSLMENFAYMFWVSQFHLSVFYALLSSEEAPTFRWLQKRGEPPNVSMFLYDTPPLQNIGL